MSALHSSPLWMRFLIWPVTPMCRDSSRQQLNLMNCCRSGLSDTDDCCAIHIGVEECCAFHELGHPYCACHGCIAPSLSGLGIRIEARYFNYLNNNWGDAGNRKQSGQQPCPPQPTNPLPNKKMNHINFKQSYSNLATKPAQVTKFVPKALRNCPATSFCRRSDF